MTEEMLRKALENRQEKTVLEAHSKLVQKIKSRQAIYVQIDNEYENPLRLKFAINSRELIELELLRLNQRIDDLDIEFQKMKGE